MLHGRSGNAIGTLASRSHRRSAAQLLGRQKEHVRHLVVLIRRPELRLVSDTCADQDLSPKPLFLAPHHLGCAFSAEAVQAALAPCRGRREATR